MNRVPTDREDTLQTYLAALMTARLDGLNEDEARRAAWRAVVERAGRREIAAWNDAQKAARK